MTSSSTLVDANDAEWLDALSVVRHDVYHLPGYVSADAALLGGSAVAFVHREGDDVLLLPLVLRDIDGTHSRDAVSPYGYPGPVSTVGVDGAAFWGRAVEALASTLLAAGVVTCFVRLNPLFDVPDDVLAASGTLVAHGRTVAVDLTAAPADRWSAIRSNHRRQINRARREGLVTVIDDWSRLADFEALYRETMTRVEADDFYYFDRAYFDRLRDGIGDHVHLVLADAPDRPAVAGAVVFECDGVVQYHLGGTRDDALALQPMKLVLSDVADWAADRGDAAFHLGGGVGGVEDALYHFKSGFSPWHLPFSTWRLVTDPGTYSALTAERAADADADDLAQFFPAYRRPASVRSDP